MCLQVAGYKHLLSVVQAKDVVLPDNIKIVQQGERWYIYDRMHYRDSSSRHFEWQQGLNKRTMANEYKQAMNKTELRFVVIPAATTTTATSAPSSSSASASSSPSSSRPQYNTVDPTSYYSPPSPSPPPPSPFEVVLPLDTPALSSDIDSDEIEGSKLWNAFHAITAYWYARTGTIGTFTAPIYQPPHELSTTLWPPRLMVSARIGDSGDEKIVGSESGGGSGDDQKGQGFNNVSQQGLEQALGQGQGQGQGQGLGQGQGPFNPIASWLLAAPVFGDAVLTILDPDGFGQTNMSTLASAILSSFPSDKWCERGSRTLLTMPHCYFEPAWTGELAPASIEKMKLPITILTEIISRRTTKKSYTKKMIKYIPTPTPTPIPTPTSTSSIYTQPPWEEGNICTSRPLVPEKTPSGWWDDGIYRWSEEEPIYNDPQSSLVDTQCQSSDPQRLSSLVDTMTGHVDDVTYSLTSLTLDKPHLHDAATADVADTASAGGSATVTAAAAAATDAAATAAGSAAAGSAPSAADTVESDRYFLSITLPRALGLFTASGSEFISASTVVGGASGQEAQDAEQALALRALWAIEEAGKVVLLTRLFCSLLIVLISCHANIISCCRG